MTDSTSTLIGLNLSKRLQTPTGDLAEDGRALNALKNDTQDREGLRWLVTGLRLHCLHMPEGEHRNGDGAAGRPENGQRLTAAKVRLAVVEDDVLAEQFGIVNSEGAPRVVSSCLHLRVSLIHHVKEPRLETA
jgi:hypothetical protein